MSLQADEADVGRYNEFRDANQYHLYGYDAGGELGSRKHVGGYG